MAHNSGCRFSLFLVKRPLNVDNPLLILIGVVAQLGERRVRNAEVRGSSPLDSTNKITENVSLLKGRLYRWPFCV